MLNRGADRILDIFEAVSECPEGLGLSELARHLSLPKSSTSNLVRTLAARGYLDHALDHRFVLGRRLFDVGACCTTGTRLQTVARPVMIGLMEKTGESVFLGTLTPAYEVLHLDKVVAAQVIRYDAEVGQTVPAYCAAIGKVLLAYLPSDQLERYLQTTKLERLTPRTITDRRKLIVELTSIRQRGVAINIEERVPGASAIAAPIAPLTGRPLAAVLVAGPTDRIVTRQEKLYRAVKAAAAAIAIRLGKPERPRGRQALVTLTRGGRRGRVGADERLASRDNKQLRVSGGTSGRRG